MLSIKSSISFSSELPLVAWPKAFHVLIFVAAWWLGAGMASKITFISHPLQCKLVYSAGLVLSLVSNILVCASLEQVCRISECHRSHAECKPQPVKSSALGHSTAKPHWRRWEIERTIATCFAAEGALGSMELPDSVAAKGSLNMEWDATTTRGEHIILRSLLRAIREMEKAKIKAKVCSLMLPSAFLWLR